MHTSPFAHVTRYAVIPIMLVATGCASTTITAVHDPLYRAAPHTSTITATANNTESGIKTISMTVTTGDMVDCSVIGLGGGGVIPCRHNATTVTHVCSFAGSPANASCAYPQVLPDNSLVTYSAQAEPVSGSTVATEEITYSGGAPTDPTLARPIWWRRNSAMTQKIDVGFFPDADYGSNYALFATDADTIAKGAFFNPGQQFAGTYSAFNGTFNLWAGPAGADGNGCTRTWAPALADIVSSMDGSAILHRTAFRDCSNISLGGSGTVQATAGAPAVILTHESGHFLFGQGDEYCCDGGYGFAGSCGNVFGTQADCQAAAVGGGTCVKIISGANDTNMWRGDTGQPETMANASFGSDWRDNSHKCVVDRIFGCSNPTCY